VAHGKQNKEIAEALSIAVHTVERHLTHIYQKLAVSNRTEASIRWQQFSTTIDTGNPAFTTELGATTLQSQGM
jgi:predicted ArsR family transcriptional regulator